MDRIDVSAPGKLVLFGEYAVLFGAPALVAAVSRRAGASLRPSAEGNWVVSAPGLSTQPARFEIGPGGAVRWHDEELGRGTFGLVSALLEGIQGSAGMELEALPATAMTLDTRPFFVNDAKLGLGSSAALTVALAFALKAWAGMELKTGRIERLQEFVDLHRTVQGGAGSGIDVAASFAGGVLRYQLDGDGSVAEAAPLNLPADLRMAFVWTGKAASTGSFLRRLCDRRDERPQKVEPVLDELGDVAISGMNALVYDNAEGFLETVDEFCRLLDRLGAAVGMPVLSDEHRSLRSLATECGVQYKPSGAGGGDFGIAFATDVDALQVMTERAQAHGFQVPTLSVDPSGAASC